MVHPTFTLVLLIFTLHIAIGRCILVKPLTVVLLGSLWIVFWAVIGIVVNFFTLEASIGLDWVIGLLFLASVFTALPW